MSYQIFKRHGRIPKYVFLHESSQSGNTTYCMVPTIWHPGKGKSIVTIKKKKSVVARGNGRGRGELAEYRGFLG